jgi:hypothetical protein
VPRQQRRGQRGDSESRDRARTAPDRAPRYHGQGVWSSIDGGSRGIRSSAGWRR